jgi:hypothetical protein
VPLAERGREDRQRRGRHHRRPDALHHSRRDQHAFGLGESGRERARGEHNQTRDEDAATSQQVRESASEQQKPAVGQQVAAGPPLEVLLGEVERALD